MSSHGWSGGDGRSVSPVIGVILMVAIVVVLSGVVFAMLTAVTGDKQEPAPTVGVTMDFDRSSRWVSIVHNSGDDVDMKNVEIVVKVPEDDKKSRLVELPVKNSGGNDLEPKNVEGDDIFDDGVGGISGALRDGDGTWSAGEEIGFRLPKSDVNIDTGDKIRVTVVDTDKDATVLDLTLSG